MRGRHALRRPTLLPAACALLAVLAAGAQLAPVGTAQDAAQAAPTCAEGRLHLAQLEDGTLALRSRAPEPGVIALPTTPTLVTFAPVAVRADGTASLVGYRVLVEPFAPVTQASVPGAAIVVNATMHLLVDEVIDANAEVSVERTQSPLATGPTELAGERTLRDVPLPRGARLGFGIYLTHVGASGLSGALVAVGPNASYVELPGIATCNAPPEASFDLDNTDPLSVAMRDTSRDPDGTVARIEWVLPGGEIVEGVPGETFTRALPAGPVQIGLRVYDDEGDVATALRTTTVRRPEDPRAAFTGPSHAQVGQSVSFFDASEAFSGATVDRRAWDFGDGSRAFERHPIHLYARSGDYTVRLDVTDSRGAEAFATQTIRVTDRPVTPTAPPASPPPCSSPVPPPECLPPAQGPRLSFVSPRSGAFVHADDPVVLAIERGDPRAVTVLATNVEDNGSALACGSVTGAHLSCAFLAGGFPPGAYVLRAQIETSEGLATASRVVLFDEARFEGLRLWGGALLLAVGGVALPALSRGTLGLRASSPPAASVPVLVGVACLAALLASGGGLVTGLRFPTFVLVLAVLATGAIVLAVLDVFGRRRQDLLAVRTRGLLALLVAVGTGISVVLVALLALALDPAGRPFADAARGLLPAFLAASVLALAIGAALPPRPWVSAGAAAMLGAFVFGVPSPLATSAQARPRSWRLAALSAVAALAWLVLLTAGWGDDVEYAHGAWLTARLLTVGALVAILVLALPWHPCDGAALRARSLHLAACALVLVACIAWSATGARALPLIALACALGAGIWGALTSSRSDDPLSAPVIHMDPSLATPPLPPPPPPPPRPSESRKPRGD